MLLGTLVRRLLNQLVLGVEVAAKHCLPQIRQCEKDHQQHNQQNPLPKCCAWLSQGNQAQAHDPLTKQRSVAEFQSGAAALLAFIFIAHNQVTCPADRRWILITVQYKLLPPCHGFEFSSAITFLPPLYVRMICEWFPVIARMEPAWKVPSGQILCIRRCQLPVMGES